METYTGQQLEGMATSRGSVPGGGAFLGVPLPEIGFAVFAPEPMIDSSRFLRLHKKCIRSALRAVMIEHHARVMPRHFERGADRRYGYGTRQKSTKEIKKRRYKHDIDLVGKGTTKRHMLNRVPQVQMKGDGTNHLTGTMRFRFPFPVSRDARKPGHITMKKMGEEIAKMTPDEQQAAVERLAELYTADLRHELKSRPKMRMKIEQGP